MRVLIVEDETDLADALAEGIRAEGYLVDIANTGEQALRITGEIDVDVVILDRDLPSLSGDMVCQTLVTIGYPARILMLTAAGTLNDRVEGLNLGADDYLAKPFAYLELLARVRALGRRRGTGGATEVLEHAGVRVDTTRHIVERDGLPIHLTPKEFAVLELLLLANGGYVSTEELLDDVWGDSYERTRGVVKIVVHTLRRKLGEPTIVHSAVGHGYRLGVA